MIDIHSHVLPQMDDGSSSPEESRQLLCRLKEQGIDTVVATPHFYAEEENPERFLRRREASFARLNEVSADCGVRILLGAEVLFYTGISHTELLSQMSIGETGLLLMEMPFCTWPESYLKEVIAVSRNTGLNIVLAHIDRYFRFQSRHVWDMLLQEGILLQVNASAFLDRKTQRNVLQMLRHQKIHFIASDCHNISVRPPRLDEAFQIIEKKLGNGAIDWLTDVSHTFFGK